MNPNIYELKKGIPDGAAITPEYAAVLLADDYAMTLQSRKLVRYFLQDWNQKNFRKLPTEELNRIAKEAWDRAKVKKAEAILARAAKREDRKKQRARFPWFEESGSFNPASLATYLIQQHHFLATPISRDGRGVELFRYQGGFFSSDGEDFARRQCTGLLEEASRVERLNEVVSLIAEFKKVPYTDINQQARALINVKNGMIDWKTGNLLAHDPKYLSITQIPTEYDAQAKSADLDQFLKAIFPADCIPLVEEFLGYLLVPTASLEKAFVAVGAGGNGKSTFLKILKHFLGKENVSAISLHTLEEDRFATSALIGKLANIYHDLDSRYLRTSGRFKSIVSGDPIGSEKKYADYCMFEPYARLVFSANAFPKSRDLSTAYFDRLIFVNFPHTFRGTAAQVLDYDQVLVAKPGFLPSLLNRALGGLQRLMKNQRFSEAESSRELVESYKRECSNALDYLSENCVKDPTGRIYRKELYQRYSLWCSGHGVVQVSDREFAEAAREFGGAGRKTNGVRYWAGISWAPSDSGTGNS